MIRVTKWIGGALLLLALLMGAVLLLLDTAIGHRFVADRIGAIRTDNGLRFGVGRIDGSLWSAATLVDVRVYDPEGLVLRAPVARLDWRPFAWVHHRLDIRALTIPQASVLKPLHPRETGHRGPILPDVDIALGRLSVGRLDLAPRVTGVARTGALEGRALLHAGRAAVALDARVAGSDEVRLRLDAEPDRDRFDLSARARGAAGGVLARMSGLRGPLALDIGGAGDWHAWRGRARLDAGGARVADLGVGAREGAYTLSGALGLAGVTHGKLKSLAGPRTLVSGRATLADRRLAGHLTLRSFAIAIAADGTVDLGERAFRDLRLHARLLSPHALFPNMTGRDVTLRMTLDGPFATAGFDYRLDGGHVQFDDTGFDALSAAGRGRFSLSPVLVPIRLTAARVTGVGAVAGGILARAQAEGVLRVTAGDITGDGIRFRSDKLAGRFSLRVDLDTGAFQVGLNATLGRYLIPGLGIVDVGSDLSVQPGPGGHGTRILGRGSARMLRLDNAFFRSLLGGLPSLATELERTPDGVLHFAGLRLTAPTFRLAGNGFRRTDGSFHVEGTGTQTTYGAFTLRLDGQIDHPTLDLVFARPNAALGLGTVRLHLDPNPAGFAFTATGDSRLGPFAGVGQIALPAGGQAAIQVARLDVSGTRATGTLAIVDGGFDGQLRLGGGGWSGVLALRPVGSVQRIEAHLLASGARLADLASVRRGRLDASVMLEPAGSVVDATASGVGLRHGGVNLARFAGHLALAGDTGELRASVAGTRGRAFELQTVTRIAPDRYAIGAQGSLDGRPIALAGPAVVATDGDGWRLDPVRLSFAGGEARLSARSAGGSFALDASLRTLPLALADIAAPGLGLGGSASGSLSYRSGAGAPPTGRVDVTVRGLTRSGLVTSSRPIDLGLAGVLSADRLGARMVMASGGRTIGRAQALLTLGNGGDLPTRLSAAPLVAQLRYAGPADTLWRLTGVEIVDLSGPVSIAADLGGRLSDPAIRGVLTTTGARIESAVTGTVLTNVAAAGRFDGSRLVIDRMAADAGKGGRVTGAGQFEFARARGIGIDLRLQAANAALINRDDIAATVTGPLAIRSGGSGGTIGGDVTLVRSRYRLGQAAGASAVPQLPVREINLPGGGEEEDAPAQPWRLDLRARAANGLRVTGLGLNSEWSADLRIGGVPENPQITGRATLIRGDVAFAGRDFQLSRGILRFGGELPADPALDIAADATATDLSATIRVTGTAAKPEIAFTSNPALPQDELLSRLLFGTSITNLSAPEALQLASAVAALQGGRGGGLDPINAVRRVAGLDRLRILPADPQTGQGTSIAAGKYVTRRLYAEVVTDGQGYSATQVEFQVTRWLSVLSSISTLGRTSGNLRVSRDY